MGWTGSEGQFYRQCSAIDCVSYTSIQFWCSRSQVSTELTGQRAQFPKMFLTGHTTLKSQVISQPPVLLFSMATNQEFLQLPSRSDNLLEWLAELKKLFYLWLPFYCLKYKWIARGRDTHRSKVWNGSAGRSFCPWGVRVFQRSHPHSSACSPTQTLSEPPCSEF